MQNYYDTQAEKLKILDNEENYIKIKIFSFFGTETNYMNITKDQLKKIIAILKDSQ